MTGWISLHRSIEDHWLYTEDRKFSRLEAWIDLLLMVNHKDNKTVHDGKLVLVKRGSRITSLRKLGERWNWSITKVDTFLNLLQDDEMITVKKDSKKTLVSIVNYDLYQNEDLRKRQSKDTEKTQKENRKETEKKQKETNNNDNNELIMSNNENNDNNDNNYYRSSSQFEQDVTDIFHFYQENGYGHVNSHVGENLRKAYQYFDNKDLIIRALEIGIEKNRMTLGYVNGIFKQWKNKNIKTVEQANAESEAFKQKMAQKSYHGQPLKRGIEPEWLKEERQKENQELEKNKNEEPDEETQKSIEDFQRVLAEYKKSDKSTKAMKVNTENM